MTANMNFGPKWMRGGDETTNNFKSPLEETNEFKYSKEFMLSLYQPYQIPDRFERHEHITVEESLPPKSFEPPSEAEKKILAGPVHSISSRRNITAAEKSQIQARNDLSGSPTNSPSSENAPTTAGRMARKGRSSDYFAKDQPFKRGDSDHLRRRDPNDASLPSLRPDENDGFGWQKPAATSTSTSSGSGFSSLFRNDDNSSGSLFNRPAVFGGDMGGPMFGSNPSSLMASLTAQKKPEEFKWFYRDPSGQVQGPFEATEMQDWFVAGFFSNSLMVRRDDETAFEPLAMLIKKVGNEREPFMAAFASTSSTSDFSRPSDLFSSPSIESPSSHLFRSSATSALGDNAKYMPFSGGGVSNGGGGNNPNALFQTPYGNYGGGSGTSLLRDGNNPWSDSQQQQPQQQPQQQQPQKPSWLNSSPGSTSDLFGSTSTPLGINPLGGSGGGGGVSSMSPMFGGAGVGGVGGMGASASSPGLFDYQRMANDQMDQHQQYLQMLQQKQQQQNMQFQQHLQVMQQQQQQQQHQFQQQQQQLQYQQIQPQQMQQQPMQSFQQQQQQQQQQPMQPPQQPIQQIQGDEAEQESSLVNNNNNPLSQNPLKNLSLDLGGSNHASPVLRSNVLSTGGWGSIPGTPVGNDSPSSPWGSIVSNAIPTKISEELQAKAPGAQSPRAPSSPKKPIERTLIKTKPVEEALANLQLEEEIIEKRQPVKKESPVVSEKPKPVTQAAPKPIVSLREIQEEEMRKAEEKKQKQPKVPVATWGPTPSTSPSVSSSNAGSWSQPVSSQKPLSLREIQEMEAKEAAANKRDSPSAAEYLSAAQNSTPSNLSWGVVVPNSNNVAKSQAQTQATAPWSAPTAPKKTLREIQLEEEAAMKKKSTKAAKAAVFATAAASTPSPKTYAVSSSVNDGSWTTVSNVRTAKPVVPVTPPPVRYEPVQQKPIQRTPVHVERSGPSEEFRRWCKQSLRGLNSGVNGEEILSMLLSFPLDAGSAEIIEDVIYANSESMNGKRFAEEFMKLRRADIAGKLDSAIAMIEEDDDFKVVTKKGKKKNP